MLVSFSNKTYLSYLSANILEDICYKTVVLGVLYAIPVVVGCSNVIFDEIEKNSSHSRKNNAESSSWRKQ